MRESPHEYGRISKKEQHPKGCCFWRAGKEEPQSADGEDFFFFAKSCIINSSKQCKQILHGIRKGTGGSLSLLPAYLFLRLSHHLKTVRSAGASRLVHNNANISSMRITSFHRRIPYCITARRGQRKKGTASERVLFLYAPERIGFFFTVFGNFPFFLR